MTEGFDRAMDPRDTTSNADDAPPGVVRLTARIVNKQGLHARPSTLIVKTSSRFKASASLTIRGETANARSIMEVMMLASPAGTEVLIETNGEDAAACAEALADVFAKGFGEEMA